MARKLKKLDAVIDVAIISPKMTPQGWAFAAFPGSTSDPIFGARYMHQIYTATDPTVSGRATVPALFDKEQRVIVNNESADIVRMLNSAFNEWGGASMDLYPAALRPEIDALEARLMAGGPFLFGEALTETDIRLFATLARFELAYHGLFKCNRRRLIDYPALSAYVRRGHAPPGVAETVNPAHITAGYYSISALNPNGVVPIGPSSLFGDAPIAA